MSSLDVIQLFIDKANKLQSERRFDALDREQKISSLGMDSLLIMEIVGDIQDELDISLSDEELGQVQTLADLEELVSKTLEA